MSQNPYQELFLFCEPCVIIGKSEKLSTLLKEACEDISEALH